MKNKLTLGERIDDLLKDKKITQTEFCENYGVNKKTLSMIITGERSDPRISTLIPIAKGLNVSIDYLLGINDEPSTDLELKDISKKTGLNVDVVNKMINGYFEVAEINVLNDILGNDFSSFLLESCKKYFEFISFGFDVYVFSNGPISTDVSEDGSSTLHFSAIENDENEADIISDEEFESILCNSIISYLKKIKEDSELSYKSNIEKLEYAKHCLQNAKENYKMLSREKLIENLSKIEDKEFANETFKIFDEHYRKMRIGIEREIKDLEYKIMMYEQRKTKI